MHAYVRVVHVRAAGRVQSGEPPPGRAPHWDVSRGPCRGLASTSWGPQRRDVGMSRVVGYLRHHGARGAEMRDGEMRSGPRASG